jgi:hypothetical protein
MNWTNVASTVLWRMRRVVGGLAAALLLIPMPAMAITYLGSWQASYSQSGGPTPPTPTFSDSGVSGQNDTVLVDMGEYQGSTAKATSTIELTRDISISSSSQVIQFDHSFAGLFEQAGYSVTVAVENSKGQVVVTPISISKTTTSTTFKELQDSLNVNERLSKGSYTLVVTVTDATNNKIGGWKRHNSQSHEFDFQGQ